MFSLYYYVIFYDYFIPRSDPPLSLDKRDRSTSKELYSVNVMIELPCRSFHTQDVAESDSEIPSERGKMLVARVEILFSALGERRVWEQRKCFRSFPSYDRVSRGIG